MPSRNLGRTKEGDSSLVEFSKINPSLAISKIAFGNKPKVNLPTQKQDEFIKRQEIKKEEIRKISFCGHKINLDNKREKIYEILAEGMEKKGIGEYKNGIKLFLYVATSEDIENLQSGNNAQEFIDNELNDINVLKNLQKLSENPNWEKLNYDIICSLVDINSSEVDINEALTDIDEEEISNYIEYVNLRNLKKDEKIKDYIERVKILLKNIENKNAVPKNTIREITGNKELDNDFLLELAKVIDERTKNGKLILNDDFSRAKSEDKEIMLAYFKYMVKVQPNNSNDYFYSLGMDDFETLCALRNEYNAPVIAKMLSCKDVSMYEIKDEIKTIKKEDVETTIKNMEMFENLGLKGIRGANYRGEEIDNEENFRARAKKLAEIYSYSSNCDDMTAAMCQSDNALEYAKLMYKYSVGPNTISLALQNNIGTDDIETIEKRFEEIKQHKNYRNENFAWIPYAIKNQESFDAWKTYEEILSGDMRADFPCFNGDDIKIFTLKYDNLEKVKERIKNIPEGYSRIAHAIMATSDEMFELSKKAEEKFKNKELSNLIFSYDFSKGEYEKAKEIYKKAELFADKYKIEPEVTAELLQEKNYGLALEMLENGINKDFIKNVCKLKKELRYFDKDKTIKAICNYQKYGDINNNEFINFISNIYCAIEFLQDENKAKSVAKLIENGYSENEIYIFTNCAESAERNENKSFEENINKSIEKGNELKKKFKNIGLILDNNSIARYANNCLTDKEAHMAILTGKKKFNPRSSLKEKIDIYQKIKQIEIDETAPNFKEGKKLLDEIKTEIENSLTNTETFVEVDFEVQNRMFQNTIKNSPKIEQTLADYDFTKFAKEGLPLSYSRKEFLEDLEIIMQEMSEEEASEVIKKLGIDLIYNENKEIIGYNGIIKLFEFEPENEKEEAVFELANEFIMENKIETDSKDVNNILNSLIKGMPEFVNIIGKQQHGTQAYSIDIHTMKVLSECLKNKKYKELSNIDKTKLKLCVLTHDIAKSEGVVDKGHQEYSALFAKSILDKYSIPSQLKDKVFELVKNHHWLEAYNTGSKTPEELAVSFRFYDDYSISKIIAEGDLKGVNDDFFGYYGSALSDEAQKPLVEAMAKLNQKGNFLYVSDSKILPAFEKKIPIVEHNGKKYKCINFTEIEDSEDLSKYGFMPNTKKDDIRFQTHMARSADNLETIMSLQEISNNSVLSTSYTSLKDNKTYYGTRFGVILDNETANIANASPYNQASGYAKDWKSFTKLKTSEKDNELLPKSLQEILGITEKEYEDLYIQFSGKKYISAIRATEEFSAGDKKIKGEVLADAILKAQDKLLETGESHNEVVGYNTKVRGFIAKANSIDEIPKEFLDFVEKYKLTIYLVGDGQK